MGITYNVNFINPFLHAVMNVLETMANIEAKPGKPYINRERTAVGDITGLLEVSGYSSGFISLTLEKNAIIKIVNNMLFESFTEIDDQISDAVGELTNMITGQARGELGAQGMSFQAGTPTITIGKGEVIGHVENAPILAIPFTTEEGNLVVEVSFADMATEE